jgi:hypothetical protein
MPAGLKQRLEGSFLYVIAAALPLAGLVLGLLRLSEQQTQEGIRLIAAAVLGTIIWVSALSL